MVINTLRGTGLPLTLLVYLLPLSGAERSADSATDFPQLHRPAKERRRRARYGVLVTLTATTGLLLSSRGAQHTLPNAQGQAKDAAAKADASAQPTKLPPQDDAERSEPEVGEDSLMAFWQEEEAESSFSSEHSELVTSTPRAQGLTRLSWAPRLNAVLQALYACKPFVQQLLALQIPTPQEAPFTVALQQLMQQLHDAQHGVLDTHELESLLMQDIQESWEDPKDQYFSYVDVLLLLQAEQLAAGLVKELFYHPAWEQEDSEASTSQQSVSSWDEQQLQVSNAADEGRLKKVAKKVRRGGARLKELGHKMSQGADHLHKQAQQYSYYAYAGTHGSNFEASVAIAEEAVVLRTRELAPYDFAVAPEEFAQQDRVRLQARIAAIVGSPDLSGAPMRLDELPAVLVLRTRRVVEWDAAATGEPLLHYPQRLGLLGADAQEDAYQLVAIMLRKSATADAPYGRYSVLTRHEQRWQEHYDGQRWDVAEHDPRLRATDNTHMLFYVRA